MAVSSVSGFRFRGNAGNPITGFLASSGERFDRFGSDDPALEGFFDLAGLLIPAGSATALYELRVEAINPQYADGNSVGPYKSPVSPSGAASPIVMTATAGDDLVQDIVMQGGPAEPLDQHEPHSFANPSALTGAGQWVASLGGYAAVDYHHFPARAGRTFSLEVTALDDNAAASEQKAQPVAGIWAPGGSDGAPPDLSQTYFTSGHPGMTRLDGMLNATGDFTIGIADYRGDGRPDFRYRARLLYGDTVTPTRATTAGGTVLSVKGMGFVPGMKVKVGNAETPLLYYAADEAMFAAPAHSDGIESITLEDPAAGAQTRMINALSYGAGPQDRLLLISGSNPQVPAGAPAPNPIRVRVVGPDNITPVAGASVLFSADTDNLALAPCGARTCLLFSDDVGEAAVTVNVRAAGVSVVAASLNNGASVSATVSGINSAAAVVAIPPRMYVARQTSAMATLTARAVGNAAPLSGRTINFQVMLGTAALSAAHVISDANGEARTTLSVTNISSEVRVSACLAPGDTPCDTFYIYPVAEAGLQLQKISGDLQYMNAGQSFLPATVRVLDANSPPNPVAGMPVRFRITAYRTQDDQTSRIDGEVVTGNFTQSVALYAAESTLYTDAFGTAHVAPVFPAAWGALTVVVSASAGAAEATFLLHTWSGSLGATNAHLLPGATVISSGTSPPIRSPSCTRAGCSAASRPSVLRRGSRAFWKGLSAAVEW